jgi:hypothetical protein
VASPLVERVNSLESKLFSVVACPKTGVMKFSHSLDQRSEAWCYFKFSPLVIKERRKQFLVHPWGKNMHINYKPLLGGTIPATPEGGIKVLFSAVATSRQPDPREDSLVIPDQTVEIPEHAGIGSNPEPTFAQHGETTECSDGIWVQVDKFTPEDVHDRDREFAWRKVKPNNKMGFKVDNSGVIYHRNVYLRNERF